MINSFLYEDIDFKSLLFIERSKRLKSLHDNQHKHQAGKPKNVNLKDQPKQNSYKSKLSIIMIKKNNFISTLDSDANYPTKIFCQKILSPSNYSFDN